MLSFLYGPLLHPYMTTGKTIALTRWAFVGKVMSQLFNIYIYIVMLSAKLRTDQGTERRVNTPQLLLLSRVLEEILGLLMSPYL